MVAVTDDIAEIRAETRRISGKLAALMASTAREIGALATEQAALVERVACLETAPPPFPEPEAPAQPPE